MYVPTNVVKYNGLDHFVHSNNLEEAFKTFTGVNIDDPDLWDKLNNDPDNEWLEGEIVEALVNDMDGFHDVELGGEDEIIVRSCHPNHQFSPLEDTFNEIQSIACHELEIGRGHFLTYILRAWQHADNENRSILLVAMKELIKKYNMKKKE